MSRKTVARFQLTASDTPPEVGRDRPGERLAGVQSQREVEVGHCSEQLSVRNVRPGGAFVNAHGSAWTVDGRLL